MFKDNNITPMSDDKFGAGSVVCGLPNRLDEVWLVVRLHDNSVCLISNTEFKMIGKPVQVNDPNYLTEAEARELVNQVGNILNWTFTDFSLLTKGHKGKLF